MDELEYITAEALMICDQGAAPDYFKPTHNTTIKVHDCLVATEKDGAPLTNIPSFKICKKTQKPCRPMTAPDTWEDTWDVKIKGAKSLIGKSTCPCNMGGTIEFMTSGQIPLPDDAAAEVEALQNQAQRELDDSGYGDSVGETGFVEGMIPVWGSGRDLVNDIQTGDVMGGVVNAGFLIWDVVSIGVGIFTFGAGTAAMQAAKAGVKGTMKAATKLVSKSALKQMGKSAFKKLSKDALKKSVDDVAKKLLKTCVFACFPAGTPVHTEFGLKNIEDIQTGDRVWAYDEETGEAGLQEVIDTVERESDHTIAIYTETEVIETTAQHPFFISGHWKDAAELQAGDKILTKDRKEVAVKDTKFKYEPKKVYNFEVANWHTYFVGVLAWLVHNAEKCLSQMMLKSQKWFQNIMRGKNFNMVMNNALKDLYSTKGLKYLDEVYVSLKNGKKGYIDGLIKGKAIIERKATDLAKVTEQTAKNYINDAFKYKDALLDGRKLTEKVFLQVENMKGVSQNVLDYAAKKGVTIIDDITQLPGL